MKAPLFLTVRICLAVLLCLISFVAPPAPVHAEAPASLSANEPMAAGRLLVKFREMVTSETTDEIFVASDLTVQRQLEGLGVYVVSVAQGEEMSTIQQLERLPAVEYAEPDYLYETLDIPNDPKYATDQWNLAQLNAPAAWDISTGSFDVIIAVIDTGVDLSHPDLKSKIVAGYDFVNSDSIAQDDEGHGTQVAGIAAAATNNGVGVAGVAWEAAIMPIKALDSSGWGTASDVAAGIRWAADHGARVINLSLGGLYPSLTLESAVNYAYDRGLLIVAAAGNFFLQGNPVFYPAAYLHVLAVTATNDLDEHASYANTGDYVDVAAPGGDPDSASDANPRHWITSTLWDGDSTYGPGAGTSMSTAHVSGLAALVWSRHLNWTNDEVERTIESTTQDRGDHGLDDVFGWGFINMHSAVALDTPPPPPLCLAESLHPYTNNFSGSWIVTNSDEDAATSRIHFSRLETENNYDFVLVKDGSGNTIQPFSGSYAGGFWSDAVPGRAVQLQLTSDYMVTKWGFCVDQIETVGYAPDIDLTLTPISVLIGPGQTTQRTLEIGNEGRGSLEFSLSVLEPLNSGSAAPRQAPEADASTVEKPPMAEPASVAPMDGDINVGPPEQSGAPLDLSAYSGSSWGLGAAMSQARYRLASATDNSLRYFAIGGNQGTNDLAVNEVYDSIANRWTTLAPMPTARMNIQAADVDGVIYVPGGYLRSSRTFLNVHEAYNIAHNTWSTKSSLPQPLAGAIIGSAGGKVYAFGGANTNDTHTSVYRYDPVIDMWETRTAMPVALAYGGAVQHGGYIYVTAGVTTGTYPSSAFLRYDPASDSWTTGPNLNTPRMSPAVITAGDHVYVIGGGGCGKLWNPCATAERYYLPSFPNGHWEVMGEVIPTPVVGAGSACAAGKMWLGGGALIDAPVNLNQYLDEGLACGGVTWLSVNPVSGSVAPDGGARAVTVTFNATDLEAGVYRVNLIITSNDPDEAQITIPVTLTVGPTYPVYLPRIVK